jgi:hypothetical protein
MLEFLSHFELASYVVTALGVPAAIYVYMREQASLRYEREYGTFDSLDDKYIELQTLCLEHSELDVFDTPFEQAPNLTEGQKKQEEALLLIRIAIFERAYLMYKRISKGTKQSQWQGWENEISEWLERPNFIQVWKNHSPYYDLEFVDYFNKLRSKN